jgi:hypothetical protein
MSPEHSYAVVWSSNGAILSGRLELLLDRLELHGRAHPLSILYAELAGASIARGEHDRLRGLPVLALVLHDGAAVRIASLEGGGALHELAGRVRSAAQP